MSINFITPEGRLVGGSLFDGSPTDDKGKPYVYTSGKNVGQPYKKYWFHLAVPKTDPNVGAFIAAIKTESRASWPQLFDAAGNCLLPKFSDKIIDGDSTVLNTKLKRPCDNAGYPGHWVFKFGGTDAPRVYVVKEIGYVIAQPHEVKVGDYYKIAGSVEGNKMTDQPGVYLNYSMAQWTRPGEVIAFSADPASVFGAPTPGAVVAAPPVAVVNHYPVAGSAPAPAPVTAGIVPAHDFLTPPAPPAVEPMYRHPANGAAYTAAQLVASGWTMEAISALPRA